MIAERYGFTAIKSLLIQYPLVQRAMALGSKPWNRSKIMLVGEGRVGKTALCNSMMGKSFVETESTVGLTKLTCDVWRAATTRNGRWTEHEKPEREFEAGIAQLVTDMESPEPTKEESLPQVSKGESKPVRTTMSKSSNAKTAHGGEPSQKNLSAREWKSTGLTSKRVKQAVVPYQPDATLVMKCLADVKLTESNLILSLFDFGGQSVFNIIHHLFLTSYGVYLVVFNMEDMLDDNKREQSLSEISFWINSIVMHTREAITNKLAPVFLIGTHKDVVCDSSDHIRISKVITERFRYNAVWGAIKKYSSSLCFFAVNNRLGQNDGVILELMSEIESVLKNADYVKEKRPLTWLKALDELMASKQNFLTQEKAFSIAVANGVEENAMQVFLSFLNEMGMVLWLDEEGLRDLVILDVINFFVEPATLIICNHIANPSDSTVHHKNIQEVCSNENAKDWDEMTQRGLVSHRLLEFFLRYKVEERNIPVVIKMLLKYGLIVRLDQTQDQASHANQFTTEQYLVPALLPSTEEDPSTFQDDNWSRVKIFNSCYFVFSVASTLNKLQIMPSLQLIKECFLPKGIMERLIGKVVQWSQLTNITNVYFVPRLYQNYVVLSLGRQQFRLVCIPRINCIRLDVEGEHPLPVHHRIFEQIDKCIKECMGSLYCATFLRLGGALEVVDGMTLVDLEAVRDSSSSINIEACPLDRKMFSCWMINRDALSSYDVFISHRWDENDDTIAKMLYDILQCHYTVGSNCRAVQLFFDIARLKGGQQFQKAFGEALAKSTVFVPIVCESALKRMVFHNPEEEDNVLIEWMLALECMRDPTHSRVRGIYPLMFGKYNDNEYVSQFDSNKIMSTLPEVIPAKSIGIVKGILKDMGVNESTGLGSRTVKSVVVDLLKYIGKVVEEKHSPKEFIIIASKNILDAIERGEISHSTGNSRVSMKVFSVTLLFYYNLHLFHCIYFIIN